MNLELQPMSFRNFVSAVLITIAVVMGAFTLQGRPIFDFGLDPTTGFYRAAAPLQRTAELPRAPMRANGITDIKGEAFDRIETDRSQLLVVLRATGRRPADAIKALKQQREELYRAVAKAGYPDVQINDFGLRAEMKAAPDATEEVRSTATMKLTLTFDRAMDFGGLLAQDGFESISEVSEALYWFSDPAAATAPLREAALQVALDRASTQLADRNYTLGGVTYKYNVEGAPAMKFRARIVHLSVVATARFHWSQTSELAH